MASFNFGVRFCGFLFIYSNQVPRAKKIIEKCRKMSEQKKRTSLIHCGIPPSTLGEKNPSENRHNTTSPRSKGDNWKVTTTKLNLSDVF